MIEALFEFNTADTVFGLVCPKTLFSKNLEPTTISNVSYIKIEVGKNRLVALVSFIPACMNISKQNFKFSYQSISTAKILEYLFRGSTKPRALSAMSEMSAC